MEATIHNETNTQQIKHLLVEGKVLTVQSVRIAVGTQELRHYIPIIKKRYDLKISSRWVQTDEGKRFKEYFI